MVALGTQALNNINFNIDESIFRSYDIRGIVDTQIDNNTIYHIGKALGTEALLQNNRSIVVGRDGRLSSPELINYLIKGLLETGINIIDVGAVPSPVLYFATYYYDTQCGAMLTASHNPAEYNGLKMIVSGNSIFGDDIKKLHTRIIKQDYISNTGSYQENFIIDYYIADVLSKIKLNKKLKIVIDCGNSIAGVIAPKLYESLGCEVVSLYTEVDGNFPNHHPDPGDLANLEDLVQAVKHHQADVGLAFDGDGDRLGVVTNTGEILLPDRQMMLFSESVLKNKNNKNNKIVFDVKCSNRLEDYITQKGGEPVISKTGHSFIKLKMKEINALLAGEMSGHIFFKERWYGFDDALYSGARLLEILSNDYPNVTLQDIAADLPNSINTPEINIKMADDIKFEFIDNLQKNHNFKNYIKIIDIDGLRVEFADGWGLVRASNTSPCLVLRFEADSVDALNRIKQEFKNNLLYLDNNLSINF